VRVYSPRAASRAAFAAALADVATTIEQAESAQATVEAADVVVCAARSRDETPTLLGAWLRPGTTVLSIGSTLPEQREVDAEVIARADLLVADMLEEVLEETGDLITARAEGIDASDKAITLADLVSGRHPGRERADQIVLYKSVGSAVQDLAVAGMCALAAQSQGMGGRMTQTISPVEK